LGSLILTHDWNGEVRGLKEVARDRRPVVPIVFFAFRIMVGAGMLILTVALLGAWLRSKGRLYRTAWYRRMLIAAMPLGWIAILAGWVVTEAGRQPYVVYGVLRTSEAASAITAPSGLVSLIAFLLLYACLFIGFLLYWLRLVLTGPEVDAPMPLTASRVATLPVLIKASPK
jgi:cytochrome d ubiquinol oxidase subunit I